MSPFLALLLAMLAVYRLARLVADEDGPFDVFARLRGAIDPDQATWIGRGLVCPLCVGFWLALPAALALGVWGVYDAWLWPLWWLAIAGGACWLHRLAERD